MDRERFHDYTRRGCHGSEQSDAPLSGEAPKAIFEPGPRGSATEAVVSLVAETKECDPLELPPLYDAVDPEALDQLCESPGDSNLRISFSYCEYDVLIEGSGVVQLLSQ